MQRTLLILALIAVAGAASAQTTSSPLPGASSETESPNTATVPSHSERQAAIAQKRIEADGYKDVQGLALGADGLWHGRALRGSAEVQVTVDRLGNVVQQ